MSEATGVILALVLIGALVLTFGAIAVAGNGLVRPLSRVAAGAGLARAHRHPGLSAGAAGPPDDVRDEGRRTDGGAGAGRGRGWQRGAGPADDEAPGDGGDQVHGPAPERQAGRRQGGAGARHFPETLVWRPEIITDAGGKATRGDPAGRLHHHLAPGHQRGLAATASWAPAIKSLRVFQPFFVDVDFPVALTQNDQVSVPVAVYNYLDRAQRVRLQLSAGELVQARRRRGPDRARRGQVGQGRHLHRRRPEAGRSTS